MGDGARRSELLTSNSDATAVLPIALGTLAWLVGLVIAIVARESLVASDRGWWIWAAAAGSITGVLALAFMVRRARRKGLAG